MAQFPILGSYLMWPNGWMHQYTTWYGGMPRPWRHCVRWGPSSPPKRGTTPNFLSSHVYCGQTAEWIKMPLGTKIGLGPDDIVLDGGSTPPNGVRPTIFGRCLWWPNGRPSHLLLSSCSNMICVQCFLWLYMPVWQRCTFFMLQANYVDGTTVGGFEV